MNQIIKLSENAGERIKEIVSSDENNSMGVRGAVKCGGCAISMASASIMTDLVKDKEEHEVKEIIEDFLGMIKENPELKSSNLKEDEKTKLMCLSGVKKYPMRVKCATLSWHTLISAIDNTQEEINTERLD